MGRYILRRLLLMVPMIVGISVILFLVMHLAPGDPASMRYGLNPEVSATAKANFREMYGLDKPVPVQYILWLRRLVTMDFGKSMIDDMPVRDKILSRLPATLLLQITSLLIIFLVAVPLGVISAVNKDSVFDRVATILVFVGYAMPGFWLALLLIMFFGIRLGWLPISGMSPWYASYLDGVSRAVDLARHMVLPVAAACFGSFAALSRYARSSVIQTMGEPYVLTARAKGLAERRVIWSHVFRNALLPVVTVIGLSVPALISGSFIFETIFAWPGMGRLGYEAIMSYDYPVVMGVGVIATLLTLFGIFLSDVLYAVVDPRVRLERDDR